MMPLSRRGLFEQMAAVLATGNHGVLHGSSLPADLPAPIRTHFSADDHPCACALVEGDGDQIRAAAMALARKDGPIVTVHAARPDADCAYHPGWLLEEVSTSINTTAAGGNASLMMIG